MGPEAWGALASIATLVLLLTLAHRPLGDYLAHVVTSRKHARVERGIYRLLGVDSGAEQTWSSYLRGVLAFSAVGIVFLYLIERMQQWLPYSLGLPAVDPTTAMNTAISFVTNTNWQSYSPEQTMGYTVQMVGLAVQNFLSAGIGIAVAVALMRGISRRGSATVGNLWVDLVRITGRVLLPLSLIAAVVLLAGGVIQNLNGFEHVTTLTGETQTIPGGPVASQEAIKLLGTNGGGFFNANSAHPFEDPTPWTSVFEIFLLLVIPFSLPRTYGALVGDRRQGRAVLATMATLALVTTSLLIWAENSPIGAAPKAAGAAMEGKEVRFGESLSALFASATTLTSTGAVNSMHDSFTAFGGGVAMVNMMFGEVAPGGVGSGIYGLLVVALVAVFVAGLMVGRTPEYLGKKVTPRVMTLASLYILVTPTLVLAGTALSFAIPPVRADIEKASLGNPGLHGVSEVLYAFTSAANNNGSAFAGLTASTPWLNCALGVAMLFGRFLPIVFVLALAGTLAAQERVPETAGTLPTHTPLFIGLTVGTVVLVSALTFLPVLALAPIAEGLS